jgi:hypothetical protein
LYVGHGADSSPSPSNFARRNGGRSALTSVHDVGDDVLGMIEFDAGHEMRVAGYVGDRETGRFRFRKHCEPSRSISGTGVMAPAREPVQLTRDKRMCE